MLCVERQKLLNGSDNRCTFEKRANTGIEFVNGTFLLVGNTNLDSGMGERTLVSTNANDITRFHVAAER